jgi:hypothetical protein
VELADISWREPVAILPGRRLGPYEIFSAIGADGIGKVYRAPGHAAGPNRCDQGFGTHLARRFKSLERFERPSANSVDGSGTRIFQPESTLLRADLLAQQ